VIFPLPVIVANLRGRRSLFSRAVLLAWFENLHNGYGDIAPKRLPGASTSTASIPSSSTSRSS